MTRFIGSKNGFALTSFIAGFVSSTSTTQSLAQKSKTSAYVNHLVGAALLANLASFIQVALLLAPLNLAWLISILPSILFMIIAAGILAFFFLKKKEPEKTLEPTTDPSERIFSLMPALKFASLLVVIKIVTNIFLMLFGAPGFIITSIVASFVGIDAIMVTLADMAGQSITFRFALITFLIINTTNLLSKTFYAYLQGKRSFTWKFLISALAIALSGALWLVFAGF
jgi:uncharacterized membrane protein (DUF4010 family)